ncbi:MAG: SDR family NAD(P)-dependent oxidoreductase [Chloroflexota bacterium]
MRKLLLLAAGIGAAALWSRRPRQMKNPIKNQVVLITGASSGIGRATALAFAARGARLALVARREDRLQDLTAEIETEYGIEALAIPADLSLEKDLRHVFETTQEHFGRVDILVNNAGMFLGGPLEEASPTDVRRLLAVNLQAIIRLTQMVLPGMIQHGKGHIVNVSSMVSLLGAPGASVYAASKIAVNGFTAALRRELRDTGIGLTNFMPGWTDTDMIRSMDADEMRAAGMLNPLIFIDEPETVAEAIIDAVRYNRNEVLFGGPMVTVGAWVARIFPGLYDFYYHYIADTEGMMDAMRTPQSHG